MSVAKRATLEAYVRRPTADVRGLLVHGPDRTAVRDLAERVLAVVTERPDDPFDVAKLSAADLEPERLDAELAALSLAGGRRVVHVRVTGDLGARERVLTEAVAEHGASTSPSTSTFLLIEAGPLDRRSVLRKAGENAPSVLTLALYEDEPADLGRMAKEVIERDGLRVPGPVLQLLAEHLPRDRGAALRSLEALVLYVGPGSGRSISDDDARSVLGRDLGSAVMETAMAAFSGRLSDTADALRRAAFVGETGPAIVRQLGAHQAKLSRVRAALTAGVAVQSAVKSAGVFWKQEREVLTQISLWSGEALEATRRVLLTADVSCKTAGAPDELIGHAAAMHIAACAAQAKRATPR